VSKNAIVSWSGGKDSCLAAMLAQAQGFIVKGFLAVLNEEGAISRSHGIPAAILQKQAEAAGVPLQLISASWQDYEQKFTDALQTAKGKWDVSYALFGDIDLDEHRAWEEKVCTKAGLQAVLPLWKKDRKSLVLQMIEDGMQMLIVSCNTKMGERFLGRYLNKELVTELESLGIDPCGEEGEFHTLVTDCKTFAFPFKVIIKEKLLHNNYWFCHLQLA